MDGPPKWRSKADIGWIRWFFNSTKAEDPKSNKDLWSHCSIPQDACPVSDTNLRGSTPYSEDATKPWKQDKPAKSGRVWALIIVSISGGIAGILIAFEIAMRMIEQIKPKSAELDDKNQVRINVLNYATKANKLKDAVSETGSTYRLNKSVGSEKLFSSHSKSASSTCVAQATDCTSDGITVISDTTAVDPHSGSHTPFTIGGVSLRSDGDKLETRELQKLLEAKMTLAQSRGLYDIAMADGPEPKGVTVTVTEVPPETKPPSSQRIDYLAGITALTALGVTVIHFLLTFLPGAIFPQYRKGVHTGEAELWMSKFSVRHVVAIGSTSLHLPTLY